jgi:PQQ-like domain
MLAAMVSLARAERSASPPRTLAVIKSPSVNDLAVDHGRIAWIASTGVGCRPTVRLLELSPRRTLTLGRENCLETDSLVLVNGRAFWNEGGYGNTSGHGRIITATAAHPAGRVLTTWNSVCDPSGCGGADLAGDGRTVVLRFRQSVDVWTGKRLRRLFASGNELGGSIVVGGGNVVVSTAGRPADPGIPGDRAVPSTVEIHALRDGALVRTMTPDDGGGRAAGAVSRTRLAMLGRQLSVYDVQSGKKLWSKRVPEPLSGSLPLRIAGRWVLFKGLNARINAADLATGRIITVARGGGSVTSFDVEGGRMIWAERVGQQNRFRVRSLLLPH